ncbi:transcription factor ATOH8 [Rhinophrynus dorsalis]
MRNLQLLEGKQWKGHCIKQISGIKKLKRKNREVIKQVNGYKSFKVGLKVDEAGQGRPAELMDLRGDGTEAALDLRDGAYLAAAGLTAPGCSQDKKGSMQREGLEALQQQPRIMMCRRPPENPYLSVSQGTYSSSGGGSPDPSASPRKRLGESVGASTEIKAIQQTRRLLANARERTRVHTISAAFEALRKQVPCYSYGQKLSKLAILRIACNYILSLARLADLDYSADHSSLSFSECVEQCTRTLQSEGRSKKRKSLWNTGSICKADSSRRQETCSDQPPDVSIPSPGKNKSLCSEVSCGRKCVEEASTETPAKKASPPM